MVFMMFLSKKVDDGAVMAPTVVMEQCSLQPLQPHLTQYDHVKQQARHTASPRTTDLGKLSTSDDCKHHC